MKSKLILALGLTAQFATAQGFLTKGLLKLATVVSKGTTVTEGSLDNVVASANVGSNLHTTKVGEVSQALFNNWKEGGDGFSVMFTKKNTFGFVQLDGTVTLDGKAMTCGDLASSTPMNTTSAKAETGFQIRSAMRERARSGSLVPRSARSQHAVKTS